MWRGLLVGAADVRVVASSLPAGRVVLVVVEGAPVLPVVVVVVLVPAAFLVTLVTGVCVGVGVGVGGWVSGRDC